MSEQDDPRQEILELEAKVREICMRSGRDPAEGVMLLLVAACHMMSTYSRKPYSELPEPLGEALGCALSAAKGFFTLRTQGGENG